MTAIERFCAHKVTVHQDRQVICCDCGKQFGSDFKRHRDERTCAEIHYATHLQEMLRQQASAQMQAMASYMDRQFLGSGGGIYDQRGDGRGGMLWRHR